MEEHYEKMTLQPYDVMRTLGILKPYLQGAALKYLMRAGRKDGTPKEQDLAKAQDSIDALIRAIEDEVPF